MTSEVMDSDKTSKRAKFMINKVVQEAMEELSSVPPEMVEEQFQKTTAMMYWVASGQLIENIPMPAGFWDSVGVIENSAHPALTYDSGETHE